MYAVDKKDVIRSAQDIPQPSVSCPCPHIVVNENKLYLAYYTLDIPAKNDEALLGIKSCNYEQELVALVEFQNIYAHMFGPPNDEALDGHPLAEYGLECYGVYLVENSSWIRILEKMNSVHPEHNSKQFYENKMHFIFTFHDSTFECIASGCITEIHKGQIKDILSIMMLRLSAEFNPSS